MRLNLGLAAGSTPTAPAAVASSEELTLRMIIFVLGLAVLVAAPAAIVEVTAVLAAASAGLAATDGLTVATCFVTIVLPSAVMTTCFFSSSCGGFDRTTFLITLASVGGAVIGFLTAIVLGRFLSDFVLVATYGLALSVSVDFITGLVVVDSCLGSGFFTAGFSVFFCGTALGFSTEDFSFDGGLTLPTLALQDFSVVTAAGLYWGIDEILVGLYVGGGLGE